MKPINKITLHEIGFGLTILVVIVCLASWSAAWDLKSKKVEVKPTKTLQEVAPEIDVMIPPPAPKKTEYQQGLESGAKEALDRVALVNLEARLRETNWNFGQMQEIVMKRMFGTNACWPFECSVTK